MNSAMPIEIGTAMSSASTAAQMVPKSERADVGPEVVGEDRGVLGLATKRRDALHDQEDGDGGERHEDHRPREHGGAGEDPIARALLRLDGGGGGAHLA